MALAAGQLLDGQYRLTGPLGEGGMGSVWAAEDMQLGREVAVKVLSPTQRESVAHKRFMREARTAAQLRSPHVAQVFGYGVHENQPFIVMERLVGEDLEHRLERGRLSPEAVAKLVDGTCAALSEAHEHGIIHRDIKPANLFFTEVVGRELVKVLDFGIATRILDSGPLTADGTIIGTPLYMSPEQSQGQDVDHRSDLWSLAVVAYEALTGVHPFAGTTDWESLAAIVKRPVKPPTELDPSLPATLDDFFHRALRRTPQQRFSNALRLSAAFDAAARGEALPEEDIATLDTAPIEIVGFEKRKRETANTDVVAVDGGRPAGQARRGSLAIAAIAMLGLAGVTWVGVAGDGEVGLRANIGLVPAAPLIEIAPTASASAAKPPLAPPSASSTQAPKIRAPARKPPKAAPPVTPPKSKGNEFGI